MFEIRERYQPRPIEFRGLRRLGDWRLKVYSVIYRPPGASDAAAALDAALYDRAIESFVGPALPTPAVTRERAGAGFVICHQGRGWHYLVLCWWDRENELPMRIWVRPRDGSADWRPARGDESICVWDLQLIAAEREAYVRLVLDRSPPDLEAYCAAATAGSSG